MKIAYTAVRAGFVDELFEENMIDCVNHNHAQRRAQDSNEQCIAYFLRMAEHYEQNARKYAEIASKKRTPLGIEYYDGEARAAKRVAKAYRHVVEILSDPGAFE